MVLGDFVELLLLGNVLPDVALGTLLLVDESANLGVGHFEDSLNDVGGGCDDMLNIVLADLVIEFLEDLFCMWGDILLSVFQLANLVAAEVVAM